MTDIIEIATREQVAIFLPGAMKKALDSYHALEILKDKQADSIATSKEYHTACKPAIAHITLLWKLAQTIEPSVDTDETSGNSLAKMMDLAAEEIRRFKTESEEENDQDLA